MTATAPVKGMVFKHAKRIDYAGQPVVCTVTSVSPTTVFWRHPLYSDRRFKTPIGAFERFCAEVVSVPEPEVKAPEPEMTEKEMSALLKQAHEAGLAAGEAATPTPMVVIQHANPFDDSSPITQVYEPVMDGVCGFAYINVPGDTRLGRYLRKCGWRRAFYGGMERGVGVFGQSMERKGVYAAAFADTLVAAGFQATYSTRMD